MENKIRNYVYQNDTNYTSYDSMKYLFVCIFLFLSLIIGTFATVAKLWWGLCILIFLDISFLLFMIVIPRIKKTYQFRFLSEGIVDTLLSLFFLSSAFILLFSTGCGSAGLTYGTLISYLLFTTMLFVYNICYSRSNVFQTHDSRPHKKNLIFLGVLIPFSGTIGMIIAKVIFKTFNFNNQVATDICYTILVLVSFLFALGYSNYLKYYYCIKYKISCDSNGDKDSPELEHEKKQKKRKISAISNKVANMPILLIIIIGVVLAPILLLFLVAFIKVMIQRM